MKRYLTFDIGCIECGESSCVVGVYATKAEADAAAERAEAAQGLNWTGEHHFMVFEIEVPS